MSQPIPVWRGAVDLAGNLRLESRGLFKAFLRKFRGQSITLVIKKAVRRKSTQQLGYLWGVIYPVIAEHCGYMDYEIEALHDALMRQLVGLKPEPNPLQLRASLSEMSHEDVSAYIEEVRHYAVTELGVVTPDAEKAEPARERRRTAA